MSYGHNPNGELAWKASGADTTRYSYDALGNLTSVRLPNGTLIAYLLDGQGRRIGRKLNGALEKGWLYQDQLRPAAELDAGGQVVSLFVYGTGGTVPDYVVKGGRFYRLVTDHLGSVRLVVDVQNCQVVQELAFDPFGRVLEDTNPGFQPFGFAGGLFDRATGLVHFGAREYDAATGRWISKDPILFGGGSSNLYAYALEDPINFMDPDGEQALRLIPRLVQRLALPARKLWGDLSFV